MISFEELFLRSKGKPIEYKGRTLVIADSFPMLTYGSVRLTFESVGSNWRQGVALKSTSGVFVYCGSDYDGKVGLALWQDAESKVVTLKVMGGCDAIRVYNIWDTGDGVTHARHNGAAIMIEELPNGRRYRCNDGFPDDDFNDIVFRIERIDK